MAQWSLDIETVPNPDVEQFLPEIIPDSRLKDPEKIVADIEKKEQARRDKFALHPETGKICCFAVHGEKECYTHASENEKELLEEIADYLKTDDTIISWNGKAFDIPFIYKRFVCNDMRPYMLHLLSSMTKRYSTYPHFDVCELVSGYNNSGIKGIWSLNFWSQLIVGHKKGDVDYAAFPEMLKTNDGRKAIEKHCLDHAVLALQIADRFKGLV